MSKISDETIEAIKNDYETSYDSNECIAERYSVHRSSVCRLATVFNWKRRPDYISGKGINSLPTDLIEHAHKLFCQDYLIADIAECVERAPQTVNDWKRRFGWRRDGTITPPKHKPEPIDNGWPKVTAEWPATERFDTPARHYHSLDKTFLPIAQPAFYKEAV